VTAMLVCYALEDRNQPFRAGIRVILRAGLESTAFLQGAWPFGLVEAIWAGVALRRWMLRSRVKA